MNEKDDEITKVYFIMASWPDSTPSVLAMFPYVLGTYDPNTCLSYAHIGQHGSACTVTPFPYFWRKATPEEYLPLMKELETIGYNLEVLEKFPHLDSYDYRKEALKNWY